MAKKETQVEASVDETFELDLIHGSVDAAMAEVGAQRPRGTYKVPYKSIKIIEGYNIRDTDTQKYRDRVRTIANSIKANGFYDDSPLSVFVAKNPETKANEIFLIRGHRRLAAIDLAVKEGFEMEMVPIVVKPKSTSMEDLQVDLYTSNDGDKLTVLETARLCKRMLSGGATAKDIAERFGFKSGKKYVDELLTLMTAPRDLQALIEDEKVGASAAIALIKEIGPTKAAKKIVSEYEKAKEKAAASGKKAEKAKVTPKSLKADKHIDDIMVDELCKALKARLAEKREAGRSGWDDPEQVTPGRLLAGADKHAKGGMLIDQIAYLAMLRYRGVTGEDILVMRGETAEKELV